MINEKGGKLMFAKFQQKYLPVIQRSVQDAYVGGSAAEMSYYTLLALIPLLILLANVIPIIPMDTGQVIQLITDFLPDQVAPFIIPVLKQYLGNVNMGVISLSSIAIIWSGSTGFTSLQRVLKRVYGIDHKNNMIFTRLISFFLAFALVLVVAVFSLLYMFGEAFFQLLEAHISLPEQLVQIISGLLSVQNLWLVLALFLFNSYLYQVVPMPGWHIKYSLIGASVSTLMMYLISTLFSYYVYYFVGQSLTSSTIGVFVVLMIYIYLFCISIVSGALINILYYRFDHLSDYLREQPAYINRRSSTWEAAEEEEIAYGNLKRMDAPIRFEDNYFSEVGDE